MRLNSQSVEKMVFTAGNRKGRWREIDTFLGGRGNSSKKCLDRTLPQYERGSPSNDPNSEHSYDSSQTAKAGGTPSPYPAGRYYSPIPTPMSSVHDSKHVGLCVPKADIWNICCKLICIDKQGIGIYRRYFLQRLCITLIRVNCAVELCNWTLTVAR